MMRRGWGLAVAGLALAACGNDGPPSSAAVTTASPSTAGARPTTTSVVPATAPAPSRVTTTTEPKPPIPEGQLVAVPLQHRQDPPVGRMQLQFHNGTDERLDVAAVRLVWDGMTTEWAPRDPVSVMVRGQVVDYPVWLVPANCVGDGTRATMPDLADARAELRLVDGTVRGVPVVDHWHVARKLYEQDCERQRIDAAVTIEWVDLHEEQFEGRPITAAEFRLTRGDATGPITVYDIRHTIPFVVDPVFTEPGEVVMSLADGENQTSVPVRFIESRCDPHALAEIKQPADFVVQIDIGDGEVRRYIARPDVDLWDDMRVTADTACVALGNVEFVGDD